MKLPVPLHLTLQSALIKAWNIDIHYWRVILILQNLIAMMIFSGFLHIVTIRLGNSLWSSFGFLRIYGRIKLEAIQSPSARVDSWSLTGLSLARLNLNTTQSNKTQVNKTPLYKTQLYKTQHQLLNTWGWVTLPRLKPTRLNSTRFNSTRLPLTIA